MIEIRGLTKRFGGQQVLRGLNLVIPDRRLTAVIGPSGGGKSVLLKLIVGLLHPDSGSVIVDGAQVSPGGAKALRRAREKFGFLFQGGALFDSLSVFDNVAFPLREKTDLPESEIAERVASHLRDVELEAMSHKHPAQLSGGMRKRVALARALILDPPIAFFDEPTTGLDPILLRSIQRLIHAAWRRLSFTGVIVSHDLPEIFEIADHVAFLDGGVIVESGPPEALERSANPQVKRFLSGGAERTPA